MHPRRPAVVADQRQRRVLRLDLGVLLAGGQPRDPGGRPGEVLHQIHRVDGLVDERPAPIERLGPPPGRRRVVVARAVPLHVAVDHVQPPQPARATTAFLMSCTAGRNRLCRITPSRTRVALAGRDERAGLAQVHVDRLLDQHVFARRRRQPAELGVGPAGRADGDRLDVGPGKELRGIGERLRLELRRQLLRPAPGRAPGRRAAGPRCPPAPPAPCRGSRRCCRRR